MKKLKTSFTIEASLVMPIVIGSLIFILIMCFYLHDKIVIKGISFETANKYAILYLNNEDTSKKNIKKIFNKLIKNRLLIIKKTNFKLLKSKDKITVKVCSKTNIPILPTLYQLIHNKEIEIKEESSAYIESDEYYKLKRKLKRSNNENNHKKQNK